MPPNRSPNCAPRLRLGAASTLALALTCLVAPSAVLADPPSSCSSDGQRAQRWLVERFLSADCTDCWTRDTLPRAPQRAVTLDWVVPAESGDDAPMAAVARRDARQRLDALPRMDGGKLVQSGWRTERIGAHRLRVQHGLAVSGHVGTSLTFRAQRGAQGPLTGWLALVEWLPAGTEGSPVPRQLVRNLLTEPIAPQPTADWPYQLWRPMNIPEGASPERLGVVGWVTDAHGRMVGLAQAHCAAKP